MAELISLADARRARGLPLPQPRPEPVEGRFREGDIVQLPDGEPGYVLLVDRDPRGPRFLVGGRGVARFYRGDELALPPAEGGAA